MIVLSFPFNEKFDILYEKNKFKDFYKEFRLDYSQDLELFPKKIADKKSIFTIREIKFGGKNDFPKKSKYKYFQNILDKTASLIDIEFENLPYFEKLTSDRTIISYHNFIEFNKTEIIEFLNQTKQYRVFCLKIAVNIENYSQLDFLFNLRKFSPHNLLIVGMGKLGKISRLLYPFYSFGTYAGFENFQTATGQITYNDIKTYNLNAVSNKYIIGGIVGGNQVYHSLGINFYNKYFINNKLNAVYLPFEADDFFDFMSFIKKNFKKNWYGFSITMPHKIIAAKYSAFNAVNLLTPEKAYNTDKIAMEKSLKKLGISEKSKILIIGTGGVARIAFEILKNYSNVFVSGRNIFKKNIPENFIKTSLDEIKYIKFDCIVNCTPIGMKGENFLKYFNLKIANKIINLPYSDFAEELSEHYISGKKFWKWQSEKQLELFVSNILNLSNN